MKIAIFGCGYVGLVTAACLAEVGNQVTAIDIDQERINLLNTGSVPIYEPGLENLVQQGLAEKNLLFTTNPVTAVTEADIIFIAVGTPQDEDGSADLNAVVNVAELIGRTLAKQTLVVVKSTVPVGTCQKVLSTINHHLQVNAEVSVASNPEFLKEGAAISDFKKPDRIVIGVDGEKSEQKLRTLYAPFNRNREKLVSMDIASAELTKYAANAMLAARISFMNEISQIAARVGADIEQVRQGIGSDPRIGHSFIYPGLGYGGSCFPKDIQALRQTARQLNYTPRILDAIEDVNQNQKLFLFEQIKRHFGGNLRGKTIAVWGLAFKPDTDDMREAPSRVLLEKLWEAGVNVKAFDPKAMPEAKRIYPSESLLTLCEDPYQSLVGSDALAVVTEWKMFWSPDFIRIKNLLRSPIIFDGRNIYSPQQLAAEGFCHYSVGRVSVLNGDENRKLALAS